MATNTAFGPQGANASTTLPAGAGANAYGAGIDTWAKDCDANGQGGTVLDAQFFNMILGNIREAVKGAITDGAAITITDGDMTLLWQAIKSYKNVTVGAGLAMAGGKITLDIPALKVMIA